MALKSAPNSIKNTGSRYVQGGTTESFPNRLGFWDRKIYTKSTSDILFTITPTYHLKPWLLASDIYGKATYQWLILQYNTILDDTTEFVTGAQIFLPTPQRVLLEFK